MNISCETEYNQKAMTAMAKALRKTVRQKKNRRSHIFGWIVVLLALFLSCWTPEYGFLFLLTKRTVITLAISAVLIVFLIWEDSINGYFGRKRLLPGTEKAKTVFQNEDYISRTKAGTTTFTYSRINTIAETDDYFVFIYSNSHAQVYDKKHFSGTTPEAFRTFLTQATGKQIVKV